MNPGLAGLRSAVRIGPGCVRNQRQCAVWVGDVVARGHAIIPCHGCRAKKKIENALLAEVTARHDSDGHRFFTLTPTIADFSGPIIAHTFWFPQPSGPIDGVIAARLVFATRIGGHLFREFVLERRHNYPKLED